MLYYAYENFQMIMSVVVYLPIHRYTSFECSQTCIQLIDDSFQKSQCRFFLPPSDSPPQGFVAHRRSYMVDGQLDRFR
jgi:hypothetical protein